MIADSNTNAYRASAPGSLMLFGEHAILYGQAALVTAINQRISVLLEPRNDEQIHTHRGTCRWESTYDLFCTCNVQPRLHWPWFKGS